MANCLHCEATIDLANGTNHRPGCPNSEDELSKDQPDTPEREEEAWERVREWVRMGKNKEDSLRDAVKETEG